MSSTSVIVEPIRDTTRRSSDTDSDSSDIEESITPREGHMNPYIKYFLTLEVCQFFCSLVLTGVVMTLCVVKLSLLSEDSPHFSLYFTPLISLVTLWIPVKNVKKINHRLKNKIKNAV